MNNRKYLYVIYENNELVQIMFANTLTKYLVGKGYLSKDEPKIYTELDNVLNKVAMAHGINIIQYDDYLQNGILVSKIITKIGQREYAFSSMSEVIQFCRDNGLSSASDNIITSTINRNLKKSTKKGYGLVWELVTETIAPSTHKIKYII